MKIFAVVAMVAIGAFCVMPWIFDHIVLAPCRNDFPLYQFINTIAGDSPFGASFSSADFNLNPVSLELTSQFFTHFSASCWTAAIVSFPIIIYLLWTFVSPALYENERRGIRRAFLFGNLMFYLGVLVGYFVVFPLALRFLATYQISSNIEIIVSLDSYMDNFYTLILVMGAVFELPLIAWLLGKMGMLTRKFFKRYRRHAIVVLLIIAAIITPTGDPFTLFAVFIPLYALWEFSASLVPSTKRADNEEI